MQESAKMVGYGIILLLSIVAVGEGKSPLLKITGMSESLPTLCLVDYMEDIVNISIKVVETGCQTENLNIASAVLELYKIDINQFNNTVNVANRSENIQFITSTGADGSKKFQWESANEDGRNIGVYAIQVTVTICDRWLVAARQMSELGYFVIGCMVRAQNTNAICTKGNSVKFLKGQSGEVWDLRRCNSVTSYYRATTTLELTTTRDYKNMYDKGLLLKDRFALVLKARKSGTSSISISLSRNSGNTDATEIVVDEVQRNLRQTFIRRRPSSTSGPTYSSELLSNAQFRDLWISWGDNEIRFGKGSVPYREQILRWDMLTPDSTYMFIAGFNAEWKFEIDICQQQSDSCDNQQPGQHWYYDISTASCTAATCSPEVSNCFKTEESCGQGCSPNIDWHYLGCYRSSQETRNPMLGVQLPDMRTSNTIDSCISRCRSNSNAHLYAAMRNGYECHCGDKLLPEQKRRASDCEIRCTGMSSQRCGAESYFSVYAIKGLPYNKTCSSSKQCDFDGAECSRTCVCGALRTYNPTLNACESLDTNIEINIYCTANCEDFKNPLRSVEFRLNCSVCTDTWVKNYTWIVRACTSTDVAACKMGNIFKTLTSLATLFRFTRENSSSQTDFAVFVEVDFKNDIQRDAGLKFSYSSVPTAGTCTVQPQTGFALLTNFSVNCVGFSVRGGLRLTFTMMSNTVNSFRKGSLFCSGCNSSVTDVKFPVGDSDNDYRLYILVSASADSGASVDVYSQVTVKPPEHSSERSNVIEVAKTLLNATSKGKSSTIQTLLETGKQNDAVQYLSIISSSINAEPANDTSSKTEIRKVIVSSLENVTVDSYTTVSTVTEVLNGATQEKSELSVSTQAVAIDLYDSLADSLKQYSAGNDVQELEKSAGDILVGVTRLLDIKVEHLGANDTLKDSFVTEQVKNSASKLLGTVNKLGETLLLSKTVNDAPTILQTDTATVQIQKLLITDLIGHNFTVDDNSTNSTTSLVFPSSMHDLGLGCSRIGIQMLHMKVNPYVWDESAQDVNTDVLSFELKQLDNQPVSVHGLSEPLTITMKLPDLEAPLNSSLLLYIVKNGASLSYNTTWSNVLIFKFTIPKNKLTVLSLTLISQIQRVKLLITETRKPSFEGVQDSGINYPDQFNLLKGNFSKFSLSDVMSQNSSNIYFTYKENADITYNGIYFVGIAVDLNDRNVLEDLKVLDKECLGNETATSCTARVEITLQFATKTLGCSYWDTQSQSWSTEGCEVSPFSTSSQLECFCTHLTAFAGGVFVLPNFVNPADIELFLTFFDNPIVVTAVVVVWILYFFLIYWARQADRKDLERVGVIAIGDVDMVHKHMYLVCVVTGWWAEAGTSANVFFYMTGTDGKSKRIKLTSAVRPCFQTGYEDWFLIATEHSLGDLQEVTMWHDNTGRSPHWYLSQVFVKDLHKKRSWTFIYNDWLAVDRGSILRTTATVKATTREQLKLNKKHNFLVKSTQDLRNTHIWISIFSKTARSTFTRAQRLTCALSLLLTTMLTNIMFYGIPTDDPEDQVSTGNTGFAISLSSIVIGIQSSLIMFPINLIIMQLFLKLKSRPAQTEMDKKAKSIYTRMIKRASQVVTQVLKKLPSDFMLQEKQSEVSCKESVLDIGRSHIRPAQDEMDKKAESIFSRMIKRTSQVVTQVLKKLPSDFMLQERQSEVSCKESVLDIGRWHIRPAQDEMDRKAKSIFTRMIKRASQVVTQVSKKLPSDFILQEKQSEVSCNESVLDIDHPIIPVDKDASKVSKQSKAFKESGSNASLAGSFNSCNASPSKSSVDSGFVVISETKEEGKILPWWFLYITWTLVLIISLVCSYFIMLYGLKYGYQRSLEWLVSFFTGFSQSAFITQPLKVLAVAIVITLIFKRTVEFEDYGPEVRLDEDDVYTSTVNKQEEPDVPYSQPLSTKLLQQIRKRVHLEWLMNVTLRDIGLYLIYMAVVSIVVYGHSSVKYAYRTTVAIEDYMVNSGCVNLNLCFFLPMDVATYYQYLNDVAVPCLADYAISDHEYATPGSSHFLIGPWRLRQLRVASGTCGDVADKLFKRFNMNVPECTGHYSFGDEERQSFNMSWAKPLSEAPDSPTPWTHQSAWKLKTIPFKATLATYSGGGYIVTMPSDADLHHGVIQDLWNSDWIDEKTRAVFLEFTLYNPNADLFSVVMIVFEFSNNGAVFPFYQIFLTQLYYYSSDFSIFIAVCECLFLIFNITFAVIEWKKLRRLGWKEYFQDAWSYVEWIQISLSFSVVGLFFQRIVSLRNIMDDFRENNKQKYISFYTVISWDYILGYVMAFLVAVVTIKAMKLLRFYKRTYMVADTIAHSKAMILSYLAASIIFGIAFSHFGTMAFGKTMENYRDMITSLFTVFNFSIGVSDLPGLQKHSRVLGPIFFVLFVCIMQFIFFTVFMAILDFGISESKVMFEKRQNQFELLEYIVRKIKTWAIK